jgi:hypothetical protein
MGSAGNWRCGFGLCGGFALNTMAFSLPWYLGMTG